MGNIDGNRKKLDENKGKTGKMVKRTMQTAAICAERAEKLFQELRVYRSLEKFLLSDC